MRFWQGLANRMALGQLVRAGTAQPLRVDSLYLSVPRFVSLTPQWLADLRVELLRFWRGLKQKIESVEIHQK